MGGILNLMFQRGLAPILIILLIAATFGYLVYSGKISLPQKQVAQTAKFDSSPTSSLDETANWKTYESSSQKFSFKYPGSLFLVDLDNKGTVLFNKDSDRQDFLKCYTPQKAIFQCSNNIVLSLSIKETPYQFPNEDFRRTEKIESYKNNQGLSWSFFNRVGPVEAVLYQSYLGTSYNSVNYEMYIDAGDGFPLFFNKTFGSNKVPGEYEDLVIKILSTFKFQ